MNVFCLPFAGGSKYSYNPYFQYTAPIKWIALEYPGRGARIREPLLKNLNQIVLDIYDQIKYKLDEPYIIYGHSMGAKVAYLLTKEIRRNDQAMPLHLFLTGSGGPSVADREPPRYLLPKEQFANTLRDLGGIPDETLNSAMLMDFYEPILRADFEALETHQHQDAEPFDIPVSVIIGTEEQVTYEDALAWQRETTIPIDVRQFPGTHFFIFDYPMEIVKAIASVLQTLSVRVR
jgi:surfactin synthase thioesterase subunit